MTSSSLIRSLCVAAGIVVLAPTVGYAASQAKHGHPKAPKNMQSAHLAIQSLPLAAPQPQRPHSGADTWMMFPVGFATIGFAIRRQRHALGSLQPLHT